MDHMRNQHGNPVGQMDAYGNPIHQQATDAYGNPIQQTAAHGVPHQATYGHEVTEGMRGNVTGAGHGVGVGGQPQMTRPDDKHRGGGILHRSASSSSSSSSEDDGVGGRRKKGLKEKIKEKMPGGHKTDNYGQQQHGYGQGTTGAGYGGTTAAGATGVHHEPEKKGMVDKIKEKMPGGHKTDDYGQQQHGYGQGTTGAGYGGTTAAGATGVHHEPEKKGMMDKIKEKMPGGHKTDDYGQQQHGYGQETTGAGYGGTTAPGATGVHHEPEKKGMMDKIKEKMPGGHKTDDYGQQEHGYGQGTTGAGYGGTTAAGATGVHHEPEKKGIMDKIKEKLPGHH